MKVKMYKNDVLIKIFSRLKLDEMHYIEKGGEGEKRLHFGIFPLIYVQGCRLCGNSKTFTVHKHLLHLFFLC